ncbi:MAG: hypothetical protein KA761_00010 [Gemmatimonadaceae bacterium]|nr:hypothetical protein [Gemmatimonadaceae bacterium]
MDDVTEVNARCMEFIGRMLVNRIRGTVDGDSGLGAPEVFGALIADVESLLDLRRRDQAAAQNPTNAQTIEIAGYRKMCNDLREILGITEAESIVGAVNALKAKASPRPPWVEGEATFTATGVPR